MPYGFIIAKEGLSPKINLLKNGSFAFTSLELLIVVKNCILVVSGGLGKIIRSLYFGRFNFLFVEQDNNIRQIEKVIPIICEILFIYFLKIFLERLKLYFIKIDY